MDRIDAMKVFVTVLDHGSLASASRTLGRSPAAVSRAIAFLERCVGAELLHRTTRSIRMSQVGEPYAEICRRVLSDLEEAGRAVSGERSAPRGTLALTAPVFSGELLLRPILDDYLDAYKAVAARLVLCDRLVNLIDEGFDIALRVAHLAASSMIAIRLGEVRRVLLGAPQYLAQHPRIAAPGDLVKHDIIAYAPLGFDSWSFAPSPGSAIPRTVPLKPRLVIDTARGAIAAAIDGRGITCAYSYQVADHVRKGELEVVLEAFENPPVPVQLITPSGRLSVPKVRYFVDLAVPRLRKEFARLAVPRVPAGLLQAAE